eukprot:CAMPEP_0168570676 /NCGR_PEP_ID=MMETSP0413-20121227/16876_1 /TAXON_ID=136452 /ORGANISM="Filamoeba nolandi, Strain NC-AS-23-1" /LENGTH=128 /DNA_ID=CAMNT_0008603371 /DNA_START=91 /DNA_END=477 /DNA_ORIENTATION=-
MSLSVISGFVLGDLAVAGSFLHLRLDVEGDKGVVGSELSHLLEVAFDCKGWLSFAFKIGGAKVWIVPAEDETVYHAPSLHRGALSGCWFAAGIWVVVLLIWAASNIKNLAISATHHRNGMGGKFGSSK